MAGQMFENREMQKRHEESRKPKAEEHEPEAENEGGSEEDMRDVVEEHGPAEHVVIHSHHSDGHVHKSGKHHDSHSAHQHVSHAFGEEPEAEHEPEAEPMPEQAPQIPTMA